MTSRPPVRRAALPRAALLACLVAGWAGPSFARDPAADPAAGATVTAAAQDPADDDAASDAAREADRRAREAEEHRARIAAATAEATAPGLAIGTLHATMASAEVFRPAPLPDEAAQAPTRTASTSDDGTSLHPDFFHMSEKTSGALPTTSSEYEHTSRVGPAGGMSLSIPMD